MGLTDAYRNIADIYFKQKKYKLALEYFELVDIYFLY